MTSLIVYSKKLDVKLFTIYEPNKDTINSINKILENTHVNKIEKKIKIEICIKSLPTEILINILEIVEEKHYDIIKLTCKLFFNIIIDIKINNLNLYALSKAFNNKLLIKRNKDVIRISNKTYNYKQIFRNYENGGVWKSNTQEWIFKKPNILFYLESVLKKSNLYGLKFYDKYQIEITKRFMFKNLYQFYLHIKERYKYNTNCNICINNKTCGFCIWIL